MSQDSEPVLTFPYDVIGGSLEYFVLAIQLREGRTLSRESAIECCAQSKKSRREEREDDSNMRPALAGK